MKRRREHGECDTREGGRGCLVFGTKVCTFRRERLGRLGILRERVRSQIRGSEIAWWISCALFGLVLALALNLLRGGVAAATVSSIVCIISFCLIFFLKAQMGVMKG